MAGSDEDEDSDSWSDSWNRWSLAFPWCSFLYHDECASTWSQVGYTISISDI